MPKKGKARKIKTVKGVYKYGPPRTVPKGLCYVDPLPWNPGGRIQDAKQKSQRQRKSKVHITRLVGKARIEGCWTNVKKIAIEEILGVCERLSQEIMETKPGYPDVS